MKLRERVGSVGEHVCTEECASVLKNWEKVNEKENSSNRNDNIDNVRSKWMYGQT